MRSRRRMAMLGGLCVAAACSSAFGQDRVSGTEKGSVLIFSKVEIRWDATGGVIQDTFIDITNDWESAVQVQMYFLHGDPPLAADGAERAHPGWKASNVRITLTGNQPAYWSALTGAPGPGGGAVTPFTALDPAGPGQLPGRPAPDGSGDRVLRGMIYAWAVNTDGCQVAWDHIKGDALIVNYMDGTAWEYNAWAFQAMGPAGDIPVPNPPSYGAVCGEIRLDGVEYAPTYERLLLDFYAVGSMAFAGGIPLQMVSVDGDLTLHPVEALLIQDGYPYTTKATFTVWNEDEHQFTALHRCITCWDQTLLSQYTDDSLGNPNHFLIGNLQTDKGKAWIEVDASTQCSSNCCIPRTTAGCASLECQMLICQVDPDCCAVAWDLDCAELAVANCDECDTLNSEYPLLGVQAKLLSFNAMPTAAAGGNLIGMGADNAAIIYTPVTGGPPPVIEPDAPMDVPGRDARRLLETMEMQIDGAIGAGGR